ncbi:MAG TPA: HAMP domain-containing sensor histidine kinase [Candidatus Polarisedimenticolaceae bacterium]|nr:HAMP domain-containing sensor histidine kinase [Candidatus Polarisedimenticolaceae bacterium]
MKLLSYPKLSRRLQVELMLSLGISVLVAGIAASAILLLIKVILHPSGLVWSTYLMVIVGLEGLVLISALLFLLRAVRQDIELEQTKEVFLALASHQLRTHPTAIKNFASMLLGEYAGKLTYKQRNYLEKLNAANESQLRIIEGLLSVAEVESRQLKLTPEPVRVVALLYEVLVDLQPRFKERRHQVELEVPDELTAITDRRCLRTAIENLLTNACTYTTAKGVIRINLSQSEGQVVLAVKDNGVGIAKKDLQRLFIKFSRISNPLSTQVAGTGLGLYLIKTIADLLKGSVSVKSKVGIGSTFTLRIAKTLSAK